MVCRSEKLGGSVLEAEVDAREVVMLHGRNGGVVGYK